MSGLAGAATELLLLLDLVCYNFCVMSNKPQNVDAYLTGLPEERREVVQVVRQAILKKLPEGYEEGIQYGMIGYYVPHELYPAGYHADPQQPLPFAGLASQKNHMAIYLMSVYGDPELEHWFRAAWTKTGKKLDMGKSCVRFKTIDTVPLEVITETVRRVPVAKFIARYESNLAATSAAKRKSTTTRSRGGKKKAGAGSSTAAQKKPAKRKARKGNRKP